jgi:anti-sigma factor ChrR (cupin superfamily)
MTTQAQKVVPDRRPTHEEIVSSPRSHFIDVENMPWTESRFPGVKVKVLYHDEATGLLTVLSRMEPGSFIPLHTHTDVEQTYVMEGSLEDEQAAATAGNFVWRPAGNTHIARAPNGCLSISFFTKPNKFFDDDVVWFPDLNKKK